jgi:hypothetical protein
MDQVTAERIAIALEKCANALDALRDKYESAAMHEINEKMLEQIKRQESGVAAPTLVFPGKPGH